MLEIYCDELVLFNMLHQDANLCHELPCAKQASSCWSCCGKTGCCAELKYQTVCSTSYCRKLVYETSVLHAGCSGRAKGSRSVCSCHFLRCRHDIRSCEHAAAAGQCCAGACSSIAEGSSKRRQHCGLQYSDHILLSIRLQWCRYALLTDIRFCIICLDL